MIYIKSFKKRMKKMKYFNLCRIKDLEDQNKKLFKSITDSGDIQKISKIDSVATELNICKDYYKSNNIKVNMLLYDLNIEDFAIWIVKHHFQYCLNKNNIEYLNKLVMFYYVDIKIIPNIE